MSKMTEAAKAIAERTMHLKDTKALAKEIAAYLLAEGGIADIDSLMRDVIACREELGIVEVTVVSAYPLSSEVRTDVMNELKIEYPNAKDLIVNEKIDHGVIGGLRIESVHDQLDLTVTAKLNTLKRLTAARAV